jgi:hypothetical protein
MSPNDAAFLKAIGVKAEEIEPRPAAATCPRCARHLTRFSNTGELFCLSCLAREQREKERYDREAVQQLALLQAQRLAQQLGRSYQRFHEERDPLTENKCRGCDAPCGARRWCASCGRDKFL